MGRCSLTVTRIGQIEVLCLFALSRQGGPSARIDASRALIILAKLLAIPMRQHSPSSPVDLVVEDDVIAFDALEEEGFEVLETHRPLTR